MDDERLFEYDTPYVPVFDYRTPKEIIHPHHAMVIPTFVSGGSFVAPAQ